MYDFVFKNLENPSYYKFEKVSCYNCGEDDYRLLLIAEDDLSGKDGNYYLDPMNLTDEYKKHGEKVWVKYSGLRRMNRCIKANPVSINEIEKRIE